MNNIDQLRVFVASPSDVQVERDGLEEVIKDINLSVEGSTSKRLELIRWETHTHPSLGSDPQAVVNEQIGDDYQIFIGILWTRFGTETPRADSGTVEEFQRARDRWNENPASIEVMFYFKDAPKAPSEIDPHQLAKVNDFRNGLKGSALFGQFNSTERFISTVRIHLSRLLLGWDNRANITRSSAIQIPEESDDDSESHLLPYSTIDDDDKGFFDLVEDGANGFEEATTIMARIVAEIESLGDEARNRTSQLNNAKDSAGQTNSTLAKKIINVVAGRMDLFAKRIEAELPSFETHYSRAISSYGRSSALLKSFGEIDREQIQDSIGNAAYLIEGIDTALESIRSFRSTIAELPPLTTHFNKSKRNSIAALNSLERHLESAHTSTEEVKSLFQEILDQTLP